MAAAGHDDAAASRAAQIKPLIETFELAEWADPALARKAVLAKIAALRERWPVGCTCEHPICVESSIRRDQVEDLLQHYESRDLPTGTDQ